MIKITKTYLELIAFDTFEERYDYLRIGGQIGVETFGYDRYLNQILYRTNEWKKLRRQVIIRDNGCDLAHPDYEIKSKRILIHHINPITVEDIINRDPKVFDMNNLITTVLDTHNAIHYGDKSLLSLPPIERRQYDTCPWKR